MGWLGMFVLFIVVIMLLIGKRKSCPHCKSDNAKDATVCQKCGREM